MHDTEFAPLRREVEKFSIEKGLGPQWLRPLTYGEGRMRATVDFNDLSRLDEEEFLNDSLIDFYMIYLFNQSKIPEEKVFFFNTFFFTKLTQNTGRESSINYRAVERWTSKLKDGIFGYDYIVIPINEDTHWYLAVICNVKNIPRQAIQEDFDDGAVQEAVNESNVAAEPVTTVEASIPETPQLADAGTTPMSAQQAIAEQEQDQPDANLFENAQLELIDRDDMGTGLQESQAGSENSSVPQSPHDASNRTTGSIFDQTTLPKTVLSNLHASPEKKKKPKRRSMAIKKDPYQPVIIILDSLGHTRSPTVRALKDWVAAEGKEKRGIEAVIKEKGFYPKSDQIPTQSNFTDCGVYLLGYAEKFFQDPDEFKRKLLTGEMTAGEDWPELKPKDMRKNLRDIIFELAKEQKLTESMKKKKKSKQPVTPGNPSLAEPSTAAPSPGVPAPPQGEPEAPVSVGVEGASKDAVSAQAGHEDLKNEHSIVPTLPRLGSPFSPQKRSKLSASAEEPNGTSMEALAISSAPVSTIQATSGSSRSTLMAAKPIDPEVHTSGRLPPLKQPQSDGQIQTASTRLDEFPKQFAPVSRSVSPLKRLRQTADEDAAEPLAKKRSVSPKPRSASNMSPSTRAPQDGHASQPIELEESQESKLAATRSPPRSNLARFTPRNQPPQALHKPQTLRHEASLEDITAFPPRTAQPKRGQPETHFIGDQLEAKLDADDLQRCQSIHPPTLGFPSRAEESELDAMEIDSQGADPMDTAEDVVRETPTPSRSSPPALDFGVDEF
jgi:sentrin-specific protease 7